MEDRTQMLWNAVDTNQLELIQILLAETEEKVRAETLLILQKRFLEVHLPNQDFKVLVCGKESSFTRKFYKGETMVPFTLLDYAMWKGHPDILELLIQRGAEAEQKKKDGVSSSKNHAIYSLGSRVQTISAC